MFAALLGSVIGALLGSVLIAGVLHAAFRLFGLSVPRFANLCYAAFAAQAIVLLAESAGPALLPATISTVIVPAFSIVGAFLAYDRLLRTPEGARMGHKAAALALGTHALFAILSFFVILPMILNAFLAPF